MPPPFFDLALSQTEWVRYTVKKERERDLTMQMLKSLFARALKLEPPWEITDD